MPDTFEYIESYFHHTLSNEERSAFEERCEKDETFAKEVAFYITTRQVLREELLKEKTKEWIKGIEKEEGEAPVIPISKRSNLIRWISYAAAACLLLVASVFLFEAQNSPQKMAVNYVKDNYSTLSHTMDASHDSLQLGISAYNDKDYEKALRLFEGVERSDPSNSDAKKYAGLVYLQQQKYNKAIQQFDELSKMRTLYNGGDFLKAVSLLERNNPGDKEQAKELLQKVADNKEEGHEKAEEWLRKI